MRCETTQDLIRYSRRIRPYFLMSVAIFAVGVVLGIIAVNYHAGLAKRLEQTLVGFVDNFRGLSKPQLAAAIFVNNTVKSAAAIILGLLVGILPVFFLLANGVALGAIVYISLGTRGIWQSTMTIIPHGILELPAVLLATSIGLMLGSYAIKRLTSKTDVTLRDELVGAIKFFCAVIVPVLFVAALVEAYLTPVIAML
jgi:stage II sporulation protein M